MSVAKKASRRSFKWLEQSNLEWLNAMGKHHVFHSLKVLKVLLLYISFKTKDGNA